MVWGRKKTQPAADKPFTEPRDGLHLKAAYARSDLFERRRRLMDDWSPAPRTARGDAASGSRPALPPACRRRIGSGPPARDGASRAHPAPRCTSGGRRRAGGAGAMRPARAWPGTSPRSRACATGTGGPGRGPGTQLAAAARYCARHVPSSFVSNCFKTVSNVCVVSAPPSRPIVSLAFFQRVSSRACSRKSWPLYVRHRGM